MCVVAADHQRDPATLVPLGDGAYGYLQPDGGWWVGNAGFLVGRDGVVSVDVCATRRRTERYLATIREVTDRPVRTVVNTHHHGDHTFGNSVVPLATIVAHERTREELRNAGPPRQLPFWNNVDWGIRDLNPPFLTYTDRVTIWVDEMPVEVRHVGLPAHTTNDSIVWVAERQLLFAGDLVSNGVTPFMLQGSVSGAIRVLEDVVRPLGARTIVPGHGGVCGPEVVDEIVGYLRFVLDTAAAGWAAELTPLEAAYACDLTPYADWIDPERIVGNLHRAYADLLGIAPGQPLDIAAAMADTIDFNGGRPLICRA